MKTDRSPPATVVLAGEFEWNHGIFFNVKFQNTKNPEHSWEGRARVDTGLGQSWLSEFVIDQLGLERLRNKALMPDPTGGTALVQEGNMYLAISIALNNAEQEDWILGKRPVLPLPETASADAILGRDILRQGDLSICSSGHYTFVVRRPLTYEVELSGGVDER